MFSDPRSRVDRSPTGGELGGGLLESYSKQVLDGILWQRELTFLCRTFLLPGLKWALLHTQDIIKDTKSLLTFSFPWARSGEWSFTYKVLDSMGRQGSSSYLRKGSLQRHEFARMGEYLVSGSGSMMIPETGPCSSNWIKELVGSCGSSRDGQRRKTPPARQCGPVWWCQDGCSF